MSDYAIENSTSSFMCGSEVFAYFCYNPSVTDVASCLVSANGDTSAGRISNPGQMGISDNIVSVLIMLQYDPTS